MAHHIVLVDSTHHSRHNIHLPSSTIITMSRLRSAALATISFFLTFVINGQQAFSLMAFLTHQHQSSRLPTLLASSSPLAFDESPTIANATEKFTSRKFCVYMEDTDAYGVMYNSNYARQYERALIHSPRNDDAKRKQWVLTAITNQKFRSTPTLGSEYVITGQLLESVADSTEVWQMELRSTDGEADVIVYNAATVTLASTPHPVTSPDVDISSSSSSSGLYHKQSFPCYPDEFDTHLQQTTNADNQTIQQHAYHIPMRSVTNFFERHRTIYLGGPDKLRKMQQEDGILFVVTACDDANIWLDAIDGANHFLGRDVIVETKFVIKRRGMVVECYHRLLMDMDEVGDSSSKSRKLLAKATMTCMALNRDTHRPTSKLPKWLMDLLIS